VVNCIFFVVVVFLFLFVFLAYIFTYVPWELPKPNWYWGHTLWRQPPQGDLQHIHTHGLMEFSFCVWYGYTVVVVVVVVVHVRCG